MLRGDLPETGPTDFPIGRLYRTMIRGAAYFLERLQKQFSDIAPLLGKSKLENTKQFSFEAGCAGHGPPPKRNVGLICSFQRPECQS